MHELHTVVLRGYIQYHFQKLGYEENELWLTVLAPNTAN